MHKALSVVVPVLVSLFLIQIMSDVLYVRAVGYQPAEGARRTIVHTPCFEHCPRPLLQPVQFR